MHSTTVITVVSIKIRSMCLIAILLESAIYDGIDLSHREHYFLAGRTR